MCNIKFNTKGAAEYLIIGGNGTHPFEKWANEFEKEQFINKNIIIIDEHFYKNVCWNISIKHFLLRVSRHMHLLKHFQAFLSIPKAKNHLRCTTSDRPEQARTNPLQVSNPEPTLTARNSL